MSLSNMLFLIFAQLLLYLDIILICRLLINKLKSNEEFLLYSKRKGFLLNALLGASQDSKKVKDISNYFDIKQSIQMGKLERGNIERYIDIDKLEKKYIRSLKSISKISRAESAVYLGLIGTEKSRKVLENYLLIERDYSVKLYLANALSDIGNHESIPFLVSSLEKAPLMYRTRVNMLIADFGEHFNKYLPKIIKDDRIEIMELIVDFASIYFSKRLKKYLINLIKNRKEMEIEAQSEMLESKCCANCAHGRNSDICDNRICKYKGLVKHNYKCLKYKKITNNVNMFSRVRDLEYKAADILARFYPKVLEDVCYLYSGDVELKNTVIRALSCFNSKENFNRLITCLKEDELARSTISSISRIIEREPEYINTVVSIFNDEKEPQIRQRLAEILSERIEYFIMKLTSKNISCAADILKQILLIGRNSEVIDFLNKNKEIDIENELVAIIKEVIPFSATLTDELKIYLDERILKKCGLKHQEVIQPKKEEKKDKKLIYTLYFILVATIMIFPVIYCARHFEILFDFLAIEQAKIYVIDFNYYLAYYSIAINSIYIVLLILSFINVRKQILRWKIKNISILFKKKMLPPISIIAPAFNEEKTIVESTNSLLNLKYPDYELIVVNDGSKDSTLEVLIKYFNLIRVDQIFHYKLNTKNVRGIYKNRSMPNLTVVDKENGGKADSLNVGINISTKEYFCAIDADSLLEEEALLKLASLTLDEELEIPALGGNILPINGCTVERGQIKDIHIPKSKLARFQTIEYIRAFMSGRLGWAALNSLLIISGAFGLFRKERVISAGGYLTSSGKYAKDTVGEDMELVVRINRFMREKKYKYKICYAFNANCWTEVPEDLKSLKKQRHRWHRGLIDILTFHKGMLFNPKYGGAGVLAMPYFLVFEMIGPMIEFQGYFMVVLAFFFGILNFKIALLLFISTILMGSFVSIFSLLIAEKNLRHFKLVDILILIGYSVIENFGPRQLFSFWRIGGYISMLGKQKGWGKLERKGFSASNTSVKV